MEFLTLRPEIIYTAFAVCIALMIVSWIIASRLNFYSLVDVAWSYGIGLIAVFYTYVGNGNWHRRLALSLLALFWSLRLGTYLLLRLKSKFPNEDYRYLEIKNNWGTNYNFRFFWFFQFQAVSIPILCLPFYLAAQVSQPINAFDAIAFLICLLGILGEAISDAQLKSFKSKQANYKKVCDVGLWKYSRHPNYFFEWLTWCGIALFAVQSTYWPLAFLSPLLMYILLNYVTGVPPTEKQSFKSKGELYLSYQKRVSRFFLWFPKNN